MTVLELAVKHNDCTARDGKVRKKVFKGDIPCRTPTQASSFCVGDPGGQNPRVELKWGDIPETTHHHQRSDMPVR